MSDAAKDAPTSFQGKKNIYTCEKCGFHVVTVDRDEGVTPFMIACRAFGCDGHMHSSMYRVFDQRIKARFEWYRPGEPELAMMSPAMQDHVRMGGLAMREIATPATKPEAA